MPDITQADIDFILDQYVQDGENWMRWQRSPKVNEQMLQLAAEVQALGISLPDYSVLSLTELMTLAENLFKKHCYEQVSGILIQYFERRILDGILSQCLSCDEDTRAYRLITQLGVPRDRGIDTLR